MNAELIPIQAHSCLYHDTPSIKAARKGCSKQKKKQGENKK